MRDLSLRSQGLPCAQRTGSLRSEPALGRSEEPAFERSEGVTLGGRLLPEWRDIHAPPKLSAHEPSAGSRRSVTRDAGGNVPAAPRVALRRVSTVTSYTTNACNRRYPRLAGRAGPSRR